MKNLKAAFKSQLTTLLQKWLGHLLGTYNKDEYINRVELVGKFVYEFLPTLDNSYADRMVVEDGSFNYFNLPSGRLPKYSFVIPEKNVFIVVGDIRSASWDEARLRGVSRPDWELYQADMSELGERTPSLPVLQGAPWPKYMFVGWNDPVSAPALNAKLKKIKKAIEEGEAK